MTGEEGFQRDCKGEVGVVGEEEGVFGRDAVKGGRRGKVGKGLEGAEVLVDGLPEEEEKHAEKGGEKAVEEVGGGEALRCCWGREQGEEALLDGSVDEGDNEECEEEDYSRHDRKHDDGVAEEPGCPFVA